MSIDPLHENAAEHCENIEVPTIPEFPIVCHTVDDLVGILDEKRNVFVSVVLHDKQYGGPEEGGWWYDTLDRIECHLVTSDQVFARLVYRFYKYFSNEGRPEITSVLSRGRFYFQIDLQPVPVREPAVRPHYE